MTRCPHCHRLRYRVDPSPLVASRQRHAYDEPCLCSGGAEARDAFEELGKAEAWPAWVMAQRALKP